MANEAITLSPDANAVALRTLQKIRDAAGTLTSMLQRAQALDAELAMDCIKVAEFELADLCRVLGVETDGSREMVQRYSEIRAANARVHELETMLGDTQNPQATQAAIKNLTDRLEAWWNKEGFGLISDISFGAYACTLNLSCNLYGDFPIIDSPTPVSDKERKQQWYESLREQGFVLIQDSRDWRVKDCDASRETLTRLLKTRLPSLRITAFTNHSLREPREFVLRSVEGHLGDIGDIHKLPV